MKLSQYKEGIVVLVLPLMKTVCAVSPEMTRHFVEECKVLKLVVHTMKNWYLDKKENVESRVLVIRLCCEAISAICANPEVAETANESHVTSSLIKLVIAHQQESGDNKTANTDEALRGNPYLNRISSFIAVLRAMSALCRGNDAITLKVAKHAMKVMLKATAMHCAGTMHIHQSQHPADPHLEQQTKVLLSVLMAFCSDGINAISSYLLKYGIGPIVVDALRRFGGVDGMPSAHREDR